MSIISTKPTPIKNYETQSELNLVLQSQNRLRIDNSEFTIGRLM